METVAEKPAFKRAFAVRRCLLPADGYFEWYPTSQTTKAGKPVKQPFFIRPADGGVLAMAGLYEIWRDPTRAEDDPERFRWTCTVLTTEAEDSLGHIHDRMPLMVERDRWAQWLDPPRRRRAVAARPGRPRQPRGLPGLHGGRQRAQQRARAGRAAAARGRPLVSAATIRVRRHPARRGAPARTPRAAAAGHPAAEPRRRRGSRRARPGGAGEALPGQGVNVMLFEQPWRVAGRKIATPPATLDDGLRAAADALRVRTPLVVGGRSAGARSAARCARSLGAAGCLALSFPLHPPGRPEQSRVDELAGARVPTLVVQGERDPMGRPEEFPATSPASTSPSCPRPTTGSRSRPGRRSPRRRRWASWSSPPWSGWCARSSATGSGNLRRLVVLRTS